MNDADRARQGLAMRKRVLGEAHVERTLAAATPATEDFQDLLTRHAWGDVWLRPGLDVRQRRLVVIATLVALGRFEELHLHVGAALESGDLRAAEVKEVLLQQAVYCGIPAANQAFHVVGSLLESPGAGA